MDASHPSATTPLLAFDKRREEQAVFDKIGWRTTPIVIAVSVVCFLDRTNLSLAAAGMTSDLHATKGQYGMAASLFFATYIAFQIPSNLVVRKLGAPLWLGFLIFLWGFVASLTGAVQNLKQLYVLRLLLGALEAGTYPGMVYYITLLYPANRRALPIGHMAAGSILGLCISAPLGALFLNMDGCQGIAGWRWLFVLEGVPSMLLGPLLPFCLPRRPVSAGFLNQREQEVWEASMRVDQCETQDAPGLWEMIASVLCNAKIWMLLLVSLLANTMRDTLIFWTPLWIQAMVEGNSLSFVVGETQANDVKGGMVLVALLSTLPYALAGVSTSLTGWTSVRFNDTKIHVFVLYFAGGILFSLLPIVNQLGTVAGFVALIGGHIGVNGAMGPYFAKLTSCLTPHNMDFGLAWTISIHNLGGLLGPVLAGCIAEATQSYAIAISSAGGMLATAGLLMLFLDHFGAVSTVQKTAWRL